MEIPSRVGECSTDPTEVAEDRQRLVDLFDRAFSRTKEETNVL